MSTQLKLTNVNTHIVDILGSVKGRDQPVMKMDKAVELVKCLEEEVFINEDYVFFDPFCKAGEILLATALVSTLYKTQKKLFFWIQFIKRYIRMIDTSLWLQMKDIIISVLGLFMEMKNLTINTLLKIFKTVVICQKLTDGLIKNNLKGG